jgi:glycosyltransferase involved in cell wall biosynthesis
MNSSKVSVIIPSYNGADYLGEAIKSVLNQTYPHFELIVVNDASNDNTNELVKGFDDQRIKYIIHDRNRGLPATRNTGIKASSGQHIAFLDHDDIFHPEKLITHVKFLEDHPHIGVTYNSRFNITQSINRIRGIWRPPNTVNLADLVLGYPFSPSDIVIRREWLEQIGLLDESNPFFGEDLNTNCRLALAGCQFALVDRVLNFRRFQPTRTRKNLDASLRNVFRNLDIIFNDPRCPDEVRKLRYTALANKYLAWTYLTMIQDETELGQEYLREAIRLKRTILDGKPCVLLDFLLNKIVNDEHGDLENEIKHIFDQLPPEIPDISEQYHWAFARGYLLKGICDFMWDRPEDGQNNFLRAKELNAVIDNSIINWLTYQLLVYKNEFGAGTTQLIVNRLSPSLMKVGGKRCYYQLKGSYFVNDAFQDYHAGNTEKVPGKVMQAVKNNPIYLVNRGVIAILLRSILENRTKPLTSIESVMNKAGIKKQRM